DMRYVSLRYFNATGYDVRGRIKVRERDVANLSPVVMEAAAGLRDEIKVFGGDYPTPDGTCVRDYIHVNDLAAAHVCAMDHLLAGRDSLVLNLGAESGSSVLEVIAAAERVLGRAISHRLVERRAGDPAELIASSARAKRLFGWTARYSELDTIFESMLPLYGLARAS
ncbi:MAG: UDP-glucose 4-epimerase, partial [Proteobacteria bacterium]